MSKAIVYQVFTRLFGNRNTARKPHGTLEENGAGKFADIDSKTLRRIRQLGATHVWFTGVIRHASATDYSVYGLPRQHPAIIKGKAGSPYAICDYYDVDPDLAIDVNNRMAEWEQLIRRTHAEGLKAVMDFVPNHVAREYRSVAKPAGVEDLGAGDDKGKHFSPANDFYYCPGEPFVCPSGGDYREFPAKATGNDCFRPCPSVNDWYETVKLNYGIDYNDWSGTPSTHFTPIPPLWDKMVAILLFWANKGVDGFRCDMAEMTPAEFWRYAIMLVKAKYPDITFIAEVYNPNLYRRYIGAGFDWLYDKVGMYDTLRAVIAGDCPASEITRRWQETDDIRENMLYFLENHDEQRIASDFFAADPAKAVPALIVEALLRSNPMMIYAGQEFGERGMDEEGFSGRDGRTTIFDYWCVESIRRGYYNRRAMLHSERRLERQYTRILNIAESIPDDAAAFDLMYANGHIRQRQFAFLRGDNMLVAVNFDCRDTDAAIVIPSHAFDFMGIKEGDVEAEDLLGNTAVKLRLKRDKAVSLTLPACGGVALKW